MYKVPSLYLAEEQEHKEQLKPKIRAELNPIKAVTSVGKEQIHFPLFSLGFPFFAFVPYLSDIIWRTLKVRKGNPVTHMV